MDAALAIEYGGMQGFGRNLLASGARREILSAQRIAGEKRG